MKISTRFLTIAALATTAGCTLQAAQAGMILAGVQNQDDVPVVGSVDRVNTGSTGFLYFAQGFSFGQSSTLDTVNILGRSPEGNDVTLFITDSLGVENAEGALGGGSILFQQTYNIDPANTGPNSSDIIWHSFDIGGLNLAGGSEYFLILSSVETAGFEIRRIDESLTSGLTTRSAVVVPGGDSFFNASWIDLGSSETLATQFVSNVVPAPGSIALMGMSGLLLLGRRRG